MDLKARAKKMKIDLPALFIALGKRETPLIAKIFAGMAVGYALSPIDLIPDFIPVIGLLDDLIIVPMLIAITIKAIPEEVLSQCRVEAENLWKNGKPQKWYYAIPIVLIWLLILILIVKAFLS